MEEYLNNLLKNLLISTDIIEKYLKRKYLEEELKIEIFMKNYINGVLTPRLVSNIEKFFKVLYEELKGEKILRIEAERNLKLRIRLI